jgi:hypothetical protein
MIVLLPFLVLKLVSDFSSRNVLMIILDGIVTVLTLLYFIDYARSAVTLDVSRVPPSISS